MKLFDRGLNEIDRGRDGLNEGLFHGFTRLTDYIPNIQQGTYYLLGGETGSGKTALVDDMFMYNPFEHLKSLPNTKMKMKIFYYSFEISTTRKIIKGIARKLYKDHSLIVDINYILSRGKYRVNDEIYKKVIDSRKYFDELEDILTIRDMPLNPTGIKIDLDRFAAQNGKVVSINETEKMYVPNDPDLYVLVIIDHIGLSKKEKGYNKKETIDQLSAILVNHRNQHNYIPIVVSQLNRSISSTDRFKLEMVQPQMSDFKDSGNTQEDCNIAAISFSPNRYNIPKYAGYKTSLLLDRFRGFSLLKNRDDPADVILGLGFLGEIGLFKELPKSEDMDEKKYKDFMKLIEEKIYKI